MKLEPKNKCQVCQKPTFKKDSVMKLIYICSLECKLIYNQQKTKTHNSQMC